MINGNWEQVKDLSDILKIISENISDEFAQKVEEICGELNLELEEKNVMLHNKISNMEDRQKEIRKLFIRVLDLAEEFLENNEYEDYMEEFDAIIGGMR